MQYRHVAQLSVFALALLWGTPGRGQEVFIGNPGKSLNFFHFDLAIERGFFRELGLDVKLLHTKCDVAVTALLTGDLQASGCVGTASRVIASQNVPVRTVIWLFKKPTFYVVARPEIKSAADLRGKTVGISSFGRVMIETLGTAVGKNVDFPPERLVDYTLLREAQKELGVQ
jgi:NitT/TauT family transport system substrate-binding protein